MSCRGVVRGKPAADKVCQLQNEADRAAVEEYEELLASC